MKRFQNATMEYNVNKNDLVIRDVNTNGIFFAIEFFENTKQIKRVFTLYPVSIEIKENNILELKFSVQNESSNQSFILMFVYYIIFFYFLQILSGILFRNLWYNWSVFKSKRGV